VFRCKECGEEITYVEATVDGWEKRATTFQGRIDVYDDGGVPEAYVGDFEEDEGESYDYIDSGYESVEEYRCPKCFCEVGPRRLADLVEVVSDEVEEEEAVHGPYELVGAVEEQHYGWFDTLGEAIDASLGSSFKSTLQFVRHEEVAVWVKEGLSQEGANFLAHAKGGELALSEGEYVIVQCSSPDRVEFGPYPRYNQAKAVCDDHTSGGGYMVRLKDRHIVYIPEASAKRVRRGEYPATEELLDEHGQDLDMVTVGVGEAKPVHSEADDLNELVAGLE
jgi:hypothetical protein